MEFREFSILNNPDSAITDPAQDETRATLSFSSDSGREYLYDDVTGAILPWNSKFEDALKLLLKDPINHNDFTVSPETRLLLRLMENFGAFVRPINLSMDLPSPATLQKQMQLSTMVCVLTVTENCNFRCSYCLFSSNYSGYRTHKIKYMSPEKAYKAIDWYVDWIKPLRDQSPSKKFALTFWGGEPLLNLRTIEASMQYAETKYPGVFIYALTTNGLLLNRSTVAILAQYKVNVTVSLDGPQSEHDRYRKDKSGRGTWGRISENLSTILAEYPEYFRTHVTSSSVYDWKTDLIAVADYFERDSAAPRPVFAVSVMPYNTDYYNQFTNNDWMRFTRMYNELRERYKHLKICGKKIPGYLSLLAGFGCVAVYNRMRWADLQFPYLPYTNCCIPGSNRVAIRVDGTLDICERVNGAFPVGHIDRGGIDMALVASVLRRYQEVILKAGCETCPVAKMCGMCFSFCGGQDGLVHRPQFCVLSKQNVKKILSTYMSILEGNPSADFTAEMDENTRLVRRLNFA